MRYIVSYDLNTPGQDYQKLYQALGALRSQRVLQSQWVLRSNNTNAVKLRDALRQYIDSNDRMLVTSLDNGEWAGWNLMCDVSKV